MEVRMTHMKLHIIIMCCPVYCQAAQLIRGAARLSQTTVTTSAVPTITTSVVPTITTEVTVPTPKKTTFESYFESRQIENQERFKSEREFRELLINREKIENKRLQMETNHKTIEMIEKKLSKLETLEMTETPLYVRLQNRVDELYTTL